jgi:UDP-glucose 4-epimerase
MNAAAGRRRVLVTGARGYLGGRICQALAVGNDFSVIGTSRRSQPPADWRGGRFASWRPDTDLKAWLGALGAVDSVIHLAGADQACSGADPSAAIAATTALTARLVDAAVAAGVRRFIYLSTAHVYGSPLVGRIDERSLPRPAHPYAITHRAAEDFVLAAHDSKRIEGVVVRLSNAIGAPASPNIDAWGLVGNDLCRQAATGPVVALVSSGEQWRDFIPLSDVASAMRHFIDLPAERLGGGVFNLGGARALRIVDLAELVAERATVLFGRRPVINRAPGPPAAPLDYRIDMILATGFRLTGDLASEIDETLRLCAGINEIRR